MRMMDELVHMYLYSAKKKVYVPIDEKDKRHNSAILLLSPSMESSITMMQLPYVFNPKLFRSFYVDRNVSAYIYGRDEKDIEFDEKEAEAVSEAMINWANKTKFKFDDHTSAMDESYIREVFNHQAVTYYARKLKILKVPDKISVVVHPNITSLRKDIPKELSSMSNTIYSYTKNNCIHLLSKMVYDPESMCGTYEIYLTMELIYALINAYDEDAPYVITRAIACSEAGLEEWMEKEKSNIIEKNDCIKFMHTVNVLKKKHGYKPIHEYIRNKDVNVFSKYTIKNLSKAMSKLIFESELSYMERQRLLPSDFGIPDKRKYPINDEDHVRAAVRMFNNCDPDDEKELAENIIKKMKKFGITDIKVSAANRFKKYYKPESVKNESFVNTDYGNIMKICSNLSGDELKRITFYDTYRDSKFVIKRIIAKIGLEPAGFLDVYLFPSNPDIAQIVIAVSNKFRGMGVAQSMVSEMLNSKLEDKYNFKMFYWTAHQDNEASQNLALKNGFTDLNTLDKYGRKIFIKTIYRPDNVIREASNLCDDYSNECMMVENAAFFFEQDSPNYTQQLRNYLYRERIKNNKETTLIYEQIKQNVPGIDKTYLKLKMYKRMNLFIDLSYYHALFLKKNIYKMDRGVNFYFEFLNRLLNNKEIDENYKKQTVFIPVGADIWNIEPGSDLLDYKKNLNPFSIIVRLIRTNPGVLRKAWGNRDFIFVSSRGYFKIDFNKFNIKELPRLKINLRKLMSVDEVIEDDYEIDTVPNADAAVDSINKKNSDSSKGIAIKMIDRIENNTNIKIDNVSGIESSQSNKTSDKFISSPHLRISNIPLDIDRKTIDKDNGIVIISIDPDGPNGFKRITNTPLKNIGNNTINSYCMPK